MPNPSLRMQDRVIQRDLSALRHSFAPEIIMKRLMKPAPLLVILLTPAAAVALGFGAGLPSAVPVPGYLIQTMGVRH